MFIHSRTKDRPFHYGPFPLEGLARDDSIVASETMRAPLATADAAPAGGLLAGVAQHYGELFARFADGPVAPKQAPVPDDLARRAADIKGAAYFSMLRRPAFAAFPRAPGCLEASGRRTIMPW